MGMTDRGELESMRVGCAVLVGMALKDLALGMAAPEKPPVSGPGGAVANAPTPESAGTGRSTLSAAAATSSYNENMLFLAGGLMALYICQRE